MPEAFLIMWGEVLGHAMMNQSPDQAARREADARPGQSPQARHRPGRDDRADAGDREGHDREQQARRATY